MKNRSFNRALEIPGVVRPGRSAYGREKSQAFFYSLTGYGVHPEKAFPWRPARGETSGEKVRGFYGKG